MGEFGLGGVFEKKCLEKLVSNPRIKDPKIEKNKKRRPFCVGAGPPRLGAPQKRQGQGGERRGEPQWGKNTGGGRGKGKIFLQKIGDGPRKKQPAQKKKKKKQRHQGFFCFHFPFFLFAAWDPPTLFSTLNFLVQKNFGDLNRGKTKKKGRGGGGGGGVGGVFVFGGAGESPQSLFVMGH